MKDSKIYGAYRELCLCAVFVSVLEKPIFQRFFEYARLADGEERKLAYSKFVSEIYEADTTLSELVGKCVFEDENAYIRKRAKGISVSRMLEGEVGKELLIFEFTVQ